MEERNALTRVYVLAGVTAALIVTLFAAMAPAARAEFGLDPDKLYLQITEGGEVTPTEQAGKAPVDGITDFTFNSTGTPPFVSPDDNVLDIRVDPPPGLATNAQALPFCFEALPSNCPLNTRVGEVALVVSVSGLQIGPVNLPLYNLHPPPHKATDFAFDMSALGIPVVHAVHVLGDLRPDDFGEFFTIDHVESSPAAVIQSKLTFYGVPADRNMGGGERTAFLRHGTTCGTFPETKVTVNSHQNPDVYKSYSQPVRQADNSDGGPVNCEAVPFEPASEVVPETTTSSSNSKYTIEVATPQNHDPDELGTSHLKKAVVEMPPGIALNPAAATELDACTDAQFKKGTDLENECPEGSVIGTATIPSPLLRDPLEGFVYVGEPLPGQQFRIFVDTQANGVIIRLVGNVDVDEDSGKITTTFDDLPEQPFDTATLEIRGGERSPLVSPDLCGEYPTKTTLTPWTHPYAPEVETTSSFTVNTGPGGQPCAATNADRPWAPEFEASRSNHAGGQNTVLAFDIDRKDGEQEFKDLDLKLPPGLTGSIKGVTKCDGAAVEAARDRDGVDERDNPSCPANSQVGSVTVAAGTGPAPFEIPGKVYLTGPYDGSPLGLAVIVPALGGPYDLGTAVVRQGINIDKNDASISVTDDVIPHIMEGVPLKIRHVRVAMDRPGFIKNPTNCDAKTITGGLVGGGADPATVDPSDPRVPVTSGVPMNNCQVLPFQPNLTMTMVNGDTSRSGHPALRFDLKNRPGDANIAAAKVVLPPQMQIDQNNIGNLCSESELATPTPCAGRKTLGTAIANTPLLNSPVTGPVYEVSGSGGLPRLAWDARGAADEPVNVLLRADTITENARIVNLFPSVPDVPVDSFTLNVEGGPAGYLVNNADLCTNVRTIKKKIKGKKGKGKGKKKRKFRKIKRYTRANVTADVSYRGQNGKLHSYAMPLQGLKCGPLPKNKKPKKGKKKRKK
jgi:hypothetical protein